MKKKTTGLVLGKFMPFHKGHQLLLSFANNFVDKLYIVLDPIKNELFPIEKRGEWLKKTIPNLEILYLKKYHPQEPKEDPNFWQIWQESLLTILPEKLDYVFASETYGFPLAEILNAQFIPFDLNREIIPISATKIRENLTLNWDYLTKIVQQDLLVKLCVFGPESTGKTTLCQQLADYFNTIYVPEYARLYIQTKGNFSQENLVEIAQGQIALEKAIVPEARLILFSDTDVLTTTIWSKWLFNNCPEVLLKLARKQTYDLYLLCDIDLEWQEDQIRYFPEKRQAFFKDCRETLNNNNCPYVVINGQGKKRLENGIKIVENYLNHHLLRFQK